MKQSRFADQVLAFGARFLGGRLVRHLRIGDQQYRRFLEGSAIATVAAAAATVQEGMFQE